MVWKFCEIWRSYGNWLSEGPNSERFYLAVWGMACMESIFLSYNLLPFYFPITNVVDFSLVTPKCVLWQTVKTQMKCCIMQHFIVVYTVCKGKTILAEWDSILFGNYNLWPQYIQWTIPSVLHQTRRKNPLVRKG